MKTEELENRVSVRSFGCGSFLFETIYRGKRISAKSHDSVSYDVITFRDEELGMTYKQALQNVHDYVVNANKKCIMPFD